MVGPSRWCVTIDDGNGDGWVETFAPDAVFRLASHPLRVEGHAALREFAAAVHIHAEGLNRHYFHNILLAGNGDAATGRADSKVVELRTGGDARIIKTARYQDRLVRLGGVWVFAERVVTWDTPHMPEQPGATEFESLSKDSQ